MSLVIREIQIKPTVRYHLTSNQNDYIFKNLDNNKCWQECEKNRIICMLLVEMQSGAVTM